MEEEKFKKLNDIQNQMLVELIKEAEEHKNDIGVNRLKEINKDNPIITSKSKTNKKKTEFEINNVDIEDDVDDVDDEYNDDSYEIDDFDIPHDLVPLPSKGLVYKNTKSKLPIGYLTASDEDLITSPNLYLDGKITDLLLRKKILDNTVNPDMLCKGDRDAILIWLRASGYGSNFPVLVTDPISGEKFETEIDLSVLKFKDFNLTPDKNGLFDFELPKMKHIVKFRFINYKDEIGYTKLLEKTNPKLKKISLTNNLKTIKDILENEKNIDSKLRLKLEQSVSHINEYIETIIDDNTMYLKNVTYLLEKSIISINGNTDKKYIKKYISYMPAYDSIALRKYINENTPGIDFKVTIQRPESLGGGSFETFLELDNTLFLNIA